MSSYAKLIRKSGDINAIAKRDRAKVSRALGESAQVMASVAYQLCAVSNNNEPGHVHTRDTIFIKQSGDLKYEVGAGGAAIFLELGTIYMEAQKFLGPAAQLAQKHLRDMLTKH